MDEFYYVHKELKILVCMKIKMIDFSFLYSDYNNINKILFKYNYKKNYNISFIIILYNMKMILLLFFHNFIFS